MRLRRAALELLVAVCLVSSARAQFPDVTLVDAPGFPGITYTGTERLRAAGGALAAAGDINRDGRPDLLVGADGGGSLPGRAYLLLGGASGPLRRELPGLVEHVIELRTGGVTPDRLGSFVAAAGDVDGDGNDDVLIGMASAGNPLVPQGGVFLVFGRDHLDGFPELFSSPEGVVLFTFATAQGLLGLSGAGAGDLNGDGFADIALGVPGGLTLRPGQPRRATGKVIVLFGGPHLRLGPAVRALDQVVPPAGLEIDGFEAESELGFAVAAAGDWNGDGRDDLVLGAPRLRGNGSAFIVLGKTGLAAAPDLAAPDGAAALELRGGALDGRTGHALAGGGDATGDGVSDLLIGAPETGRDGGPAGVVYLLPGRETHAGEGTLVLPAAGAALFRGPRGAAAGTSVAFVPDLDESGRAEILIGAPGHRTGRGAAYLAYDGAAAGESVLLEGLDTPAGAAFLVDLPGARLGAAVAGIGDRNADRRGDFALGAPGTTVREHAGVGAAFEVVPPVDPESRAPRNLTARLVPGPHVLLTWMIAGEYRSLRVHRDGQPIGEPLAGSTLKLIDTQAGAGRHVYFVEADGDPRRRSNLAEIFVRSLAVRELECFQLPGTLRVRLTWIPGDFYEALQVLIDGRPAGGLLPPHATSFELETTPGEHAIEVFDPTADPPGERAVCKVRVTEPELPAIADFSCSLEGRRSVRLGWQPAAAYDRYEVLRNGIKIAPPLPEGTSTYVDQEAPTGPLRYQLVGINASLHRGPPAVCETVVPPDGARLLGGTVMWAGGAPIRSGTIRIKDALDASSQGQVDDLGRFSVPVSGAAPYAIGFEGRVDARESRSVPTLQETRRVLVTAIATSADEDVSLRLPPPIVLVSSPAAEGPSDDDALRWRALRERIGGHGLTFPIVLPTGAARAANKLTRDVGEIERCLADELGSAPPWIDLVAYGFAGLGARAFVAGQPDHTVRKLALLGTPNLGTARAQPEARGDLAPRPPLDGGASPESGELQFKGGAEQTAEQLAQFNRLVTRTGGAEVHLVAGTAGLGVLDPVLDCDVHDDRVCEASALGGIVGATLHRVVENHETLGRGAGSVRLLAGPVLELEAGAGGAIRAEPQAGGGAGAFESSFPSSDIYSGVLEPGGTGALPLTSDTSESIIIILNSDLPGGMRLDLLTPSGETITPQSAAREDVDYQIFGDGEGHEIQAYKLEPAAIGVYTAMLENPAANGAIPYTLEAYVESDIALAMEALPAVAELDETVTVRAIVTKSQLPHAGATVEARLRRPDGSTVSLTLRDDGGGADAAAGDGIHTAVASTAGQPGVHELEVTATEAAGAFTLYRREATTRFQVKSDAARLAGFSSSGLADPDGDAIQDALWIEGSLAVARPGIFLVTGQLTSGGREVATGGNLFSVSAPGTVTYRLYFGGPEIFAAQMDGPFVLAEAVCLDGSAGFVEADIAHDAYTTADYSWRQFGLEPGDAAPPFVRGDVNEDTRNDISDSVAVFEHLFLGGRALECRDAADINDDGIVDISDGVYLLSYLFGGGTAPAAPFPACGADATAADALACESYEPCAAAR